MPEALAGAPVREWLNVEVAKPSHPRVDMLARLEDGRLYQLELQTTNDPQMARRMLEYFVLFSGQYSEIPFSK